MGLPTVVVLLPANSKGGWVRGTPTDNQRPGITTGTEGAASDDYLIGVADGEFLALIAAFLILHFDAGVHRLHRSAGEASSASTLGDAHVDFRAHRCGIWGPNAED